MTPRGYDEMTMAELIEIALFLVRGARNSAREAELALEEIWRRTK